MTNRIIAFPILLTLGLSLTVNSTFVRADPAATNAPATSAPAAPASATPAAPPVASDAAAPAPAERPTTYTVVSGDSLWLIAQKFNCSVKQLKKINNLTKNNLKPGKVLKLPPARKDDSTAPSAPATPSTPAPTATPPPPKTTSHHTVLPKAQPVQDFDLPASTFASCPTPPSSLESKPEPVVAAPHPAPATASVAKPASDPDTDTVSTPELTGIPTSSPNPLPEAVTESGTPRSVAAVNAASSLAQHSTKSGQTQATTFTASEPTSLAPAPSLTSRKPSFFDSLFKSPSPADDWGSRFVQQARQLGDRGIDYDEDWRPPGEAHSWTMDCSNTSRYLYKVTAGIELPRTASDQYYYLHLQNKAWDVPQTSSGFADCNYLRHNLKPGDLLFWENTYKPDRQPPITHVMVFLGTNAKGEWTMAGSQTGPGGEHNRRHGGPDIYVFDPTRPCGGYTTWLGMVHHQGRFCAFGRPLEADKTKLAVAAND